ncbi:J domain-containing protein [Pseudomonas sp. PDM04]|uniref:J domain-containing protein n=1 Tax=Pseudomonas sp. PDM04 TaxID=2769296 RepID=UPI0017837800|nr:J domain-containing protein [Pseudomonas sp. PDM04]MBD9439566.1 J domain-containing protein [Pseudomonas sp. PDM04]
MSHWQLLGLTADADERSIKRAYAQRLKTCRPDDDPEAFQRLREAYETSLAEARWRAEADDDVVLAPLVTTVEQHDAPVLTLEHVEAPAAISPPQPSLDEMGQWLDEGRERQVVDALRHWLASEWLLPFERRQQFDQHVLEWLESAPNWSAAFFEGVCQAMGWDETQGLLPCEYWRWDRLIRRCEMQAMEQTLRADLARFDADPIHGQAAALLLKPMSDAQRRGMADYFTGLDWQQFSKFAETIEYQYPELPERLGLKALDNWRDWLPATSFRGVYLFLWIALAALLIASLLSSVSKRDGVVVALVPLFLPALMWLGMKAYEFWSTGAVFAGSLDVRLSHWLLPRSLYRQGAGLLVLRHLLPSAVPAALAFSWSGNVPWLRWVSPVVVFLGTLYFTNAALRGGKPSMWTRASRAIKLKMGRLPWHLLKREGLLVLVAVAAMAVWVYSKMTVVV